MRRSGLVPIVAAFVVGALTALQSRINGELAVALGNGLEAALVSFGTGLAVVLVLAAIFPSIRRGVARVPGAIRGGELAWWQILGGLIGGFFVAVQTATVPLVGVAVFTVAVVAGQSANSLLVDRAGLGPAGRQPVTVSRVLSAVLAIMAVGLAVANRFVEGNVSVLPVLFAFIGGVVIAVQQAINGRVARATRSPMSASVLNFMFGTVALGAALGVVSAVSDHDPVALPGSPWWMYLGGTVGLIFIAVAAWVVPIVGVLLFALISIAGQLTGALLLDIVAPTSGTELGWNLFAGVALAFVAVTVAARGRSAPAPSAMRESAT